MKSFKVWGLVILASVIIGLAVFSLFKRGKSTNTSNGGSSNANVPPVPCDWPIRYGNSEPCNLVENLQIAINRFPIAAPPLEEDGLWGPLTAEALKALGKSDIAYGPISQRQFASEFSF
ncbi:hypothetical protein [Croceimicrobium hydrocarbonivorans]|uniref:Uncharacterized protein n=1 Tax=Croceimicrobium hydrocarbonivorans TaxID=2761580 RepID=A0A7H0VBA5_9FLAO|nr:hypothetical protein [Croceimicrobium hydrocarbonivorans]QNR22960.1 hypothetical protein H4K34_11280 [Croceimicrobium hydrocarbonivorans]QNR23003.1 hypothetical protein H4K34_11495 [Croceimicrobium hydrocarbonivorans]